ncbi:ABC transporter ATP-binding protein [Anaeromicropila herbilytica]|uniref:ABC transporter ATP-binding protein n=1 Tax=Anaeromicropila herbilytica TaxID=2785025 RepID=A0A7R7EJI4_9FIRM|nr:ABC transporter ATP-binding protein [Anaeromicropila herbilytica]BCN29855.1 ABC transporter ATP-binding protein [Anaeromicropila herbilytica]
MSEKELIRQLYNKNKINYGLSNVVCIIASLLNIASAFILKELMDVASNGSMKELYRIFIFCILFMIFLAGTLFLKRIYVNNYIYKAVNQYKNYSFQMLLKNSINAFDKEVTGKYISIFTNDINSIETNYVKGNILIVMQISNLIAGIASMAYLNWILTLCVLGISMLPILVSILFGKQLEEREKETSDRNEGFVGLVKDLITGFSVIKSFKAEKEVFHLFRDKNDIVENVKNNKRKTADMIVLFSSVSSFMVEVVTFVVGAYLAIRGIITAGTVIAFIQLLNFVLGPVGELGPLFTAKNASKALINKMAETIREEEKKEKCVEKKQFNSSIQLSDVSFEYEEGSTILDHISLDFEKGKSYVIVGASGSGKSTLINMILGYHSGYQGKIMIDDIDLQTIKESNLYDFYSIIQQNVFIFDNTIERNITMFQEFDPQQIKEAIERSGLANLVAEKGLDYPCGENGAFLSGGEKQRISIARSLIRNTPILIMDEATSALDLATSQMVENEIASLQGITRIVISHKLNEAILKKYDEIIALNNGRIVEEGSFDQLMSENGYFASLYKITKG